jgi:DNA primase
MKYDKPDIAVILEYYGARVPERRGWFGMKCPFHDDSHASASATRDDNAFCCFACQYKGDGYAIIMQKEGVEFREAINIAERIFNQSGKVLPQRSTRGGRVLGRSGNKSGAGNSRSVGRRSRATNGS